MSYPALIINQNIYHVAIRKAYDWAGNVTDQIVWTPASGKTIVITDMYISQNAAGDIIVFDETNSLTNRINRSYFGDNAGSNIPFSQRFALSAVNNSVKITTDGGGTGSIIVLGFEE